METQKRQIRLHSKGIKKILKRYDYNRAIAEYIWNGFDAQANCIELIFEENQLGPINNLEIKDNGFGIPQDKLKDKFDPFFESEKNLGEQEFRHNSAFHGKNGVGRLTFFKFATHAKWVTVYEKDKKYFTYPIEIDINDLNIYSGLNSKINETKHTKGTSVFFDGIYTLTTSTFKNEVVEYLKKEFGWFLELNKKKNFQIKINGETLDYSKLIADQEEFIIEHEETKTLFNIKYIRWKEFIEEYSQFYYLDKNSVEKYKETTTLNLQGDKFYHSLYIQSDYFYNFNFKNKGVSKTGLFEKDRSDKPFKYLHKEILTYLRKKRKPFLIEYSNQLIKEYEIQELFPQFDDDKFGQIRKEDFEEVVKGICRIEPKIFNELSQEQLKTLLGLLNALLGSTEREQILIILKSVIELTIEDKNELTDLLKVTTFSHLIKTGTLIKERYDVINNTKQIVFNKELGANERDHLQKVISDNYWIFGEQYHLVTEAEPDFEEALRRYLYILNGDNKQVEINNKDKEKEMDIFICRQNKEIDTIDNIVIELKHPNITLGEKELSQVKKYMNVILKEDRFNANNMDWEFYLVGNDFDEYIKGEIENTKVKGIRALVYSAGNYKVYVKKWSEVFTEFETKHKFIDDKLQLQKHNLEKKYGNIEKLIQDTKKLSEESVVPPITK